MLGICSLFLLLFTAYTHAGNPFFPFYLNWVGSWWEGTCFNFLIKLCHEDTMRMTLLQCFQVLTSIYFYFCRTDSWNIHEAALWWMVQQLGPSRVGICWYVLKLPFLCWTCCLSEIGLILTSPFLLCFSSHADSHLTRKVPASYSDGVYTIGGLNRPSPRKLSEVFMKGSDGLGSVMNRTVLFAFFGTYQSFKVFKLLSCLMCSKTKWFAGLDSF